MDGLLQVNWATLPQGQGINSNWCTLLLNKTDRGWHPIFSDVIVQAVYRNNISDNSKVTLGFEASPGGGVALVEYAQLHRGQPNTQFGTISMCVRTEWPCVIEAGKVVLSPGRRYLRMDSPENVSIWKLAYFTGYFGSEEDVAELQLNPSLHDSNVCGGCSSCWSLWNPIPPLQRALPGTTATKRVTVPANTAGNKDEILLRTV